MSLLPTVTRHHTAWVSCSACSPHPVRYAIDGDRLIWFADQLPNSPTTGQRVSVTVHEIAGGQALAHLSGTLREISADQIEPNAIIDLLDHVSLGRTAAEVDAAIARHRCRRIVTIDEGHARTA